MKKVIVFTFVLLILAISADAKTPPEILEPYRAYKKAFDEGDMIGATEFALVAWEKAEEVLGDHKTTGDLARNFALIDSNEFRMTGKNPNVYFDKRFGAHERSIELADYYPENERVEVELVRRFDLLDLVYAESIIRRRPLAPMKGTILTQFNKIEKVLKNNRLKGGTYDGDLETMKASYDALRGNHKKALDHADVAFEIYRNAKDEIITPYPNTLRMVKGQSLLATDKPILALLEFQTAMQSGEGIVSADDPFISGAFAAWMSVRMKLEESGRLKEAEKAGLCDCWPYEKFKNRIYPIKRPPAKMPYNAARSGHVVVKFDVDENGKPINITEVSSTASVFVAPAIQAVENWEFPKLGPNEDPANRLGITNKISFKLTGPNGKVLPE